MLWHYLKEQMLINPDKTISDGKASLTYEQTVSFAEHFAQQLDAPCYAILCQSEFSTALALLSCFAAGVTAVPLSAKYGEIHCKRILDKINPASVITDGEGELEIVDIDQEGYVDQSENRPALIMCTSGTTGDPKGVLLSQKNLFTNLCDIAAYFDIHSEDKILITRPLYHCAVLNGEFLISLIKGLDILFYSDKFDPNKVLRLIRENNITVMCGTPTSFQLLGRFFNAKENPINLRIIAISGECLGKKSAQTIRSAFPNTQIYHVYGLTEASPRVAFLPPSQFDAYSEYVGIPLPSVHVKVIDDAGNVLPENTEGELCVRGDSVMLGYYQDEEITAQVLKNGWLRTGDIASINEKGYIRIICRKDDMIIRAGMNIYPQEIENALKEDPRVEEALAYGIRDWMSGEKIGIKVKGQFASKEELIDLCHEKLPTYEYPAVVELVEDIPTNGSEKKIRCRKIDLYKKPE